MIDKEATMQIKSLLFLATAILTVWNAALIWMVQVMCYPSGRWSALRIFAAIT
jgi:hypothetical protein